MSPAKMGTIDPYLRYRKWKEKDDNGCERLRKLKDLWLFNQLPSSVGVGTAWLGPLLVQKLLIIQAFDSEPAPKIARWRPSGEGKPQIGVG